MSALFGEPSEAKPMPLYSALRGLSRAMISNSRITSASSVNTSASAVRRGPPIDTCTRVAGRRLRTHGRTAVPISSAPSWRV
ncbi:Uncharacterised protein [Nocardia farcinica]|nr:hypothetical protein [Nocardia farcinica]SUE29315.1 Uncharacterised protein [Nocardia farcinica]